MAERDQRTDAGSEKREVKTIIMNSTVKIPENRIRQKANSLQLTFMRSFITPTIFWLTAFCFCDIATAKVAEAPIASHGNYIPERVGKVGDLDSRGLIFDPANELLYDFDGEQPLKGVHVEGGEANISRDYFTTRSQSLKWQTREGDAVVFDVGIKMSRPVGYYYRYHRVSAAFFLTARNEREPAPAFAVELIDKLGVYSRSVVYLHRPGWNFFTDPAWEKGGWDKQIEKMRITRLPGVPATVYLDNVMIGASPNLAATLGSNSKEVYYEKDFVDPSLTLSPEEKAAFKTISERIIPPVVPVQKFPENVIKKYEDWRDYWHIQQKGAFANGDCPLPYYRAVPGDNRRDSSSYYAYGRYSTFCGTFGPLGAAYAACQDPEQKARLRSCLVDLARLAATYGGIPLSWYPGRGFVEGVYYGRDALEQEGLLLPLCREIIQQYGVEPMIFPDKPILCLDDARPHTGSASADYLNTCAKYTLLSVLLEPDSPQKAEYLRRMSLWLSRVTLAYIPAGDGAFKPDGSVYHHWGNRFDNYGRAATRGASDALYWLSGTPFRIEREAHERFLHLIKTFANFSFDDGSVGPPDNFNAGISYGQIMRNAALSGTPDGKSPIELECAGLFLGSGQIYSKEDAKIAERLKKEGISPAPARDALTQLSYAEMQIRRKDDWALTVWGHAKRYHVQYERDGFLFASIGGLGLVEKDKKHASWLDMKHGFLMNGRNDKMNECLTAGYHPSFAPCVTAIKADWKDLGQLYYQSGSGKSGGVVLGNRFGIFMHDFDAKINPDGWGKTVARDLAYQKTYFTFDQRVVALGRNLKAAQGQHIITGIFQESPVGKTPGILLAEDGISWKDIELGVSSDKLNWAQTAEKNLGVWLFPGQTIHGENGDLVAGLRSGPMTRLYADHGTSESKPVSYGFIYTVRPKEGEMAAFAQAMSSPSPPIRVLCDKDTVQVVADTTQNATGYVFYKGSETHGAGILLAADASCLVMTEASDGGKNLRLAVADPDMHMEMTKENPYGYSQPSTIRLTVKGKWELKKAVKTIGLRMPQVKVESDAQGNTVVQATVVDGLSTELHLEAK